MPPLTICCRCCLILTVGIGKDASVRCAVLLFCSAEADGAETARVQDQSWTNGRNASPQLS